MPTYTLVVPVHNEQEVLSHLFAELDDLTVSLDGSVEFVMVDDGSSDASWSMLVAQAQRDSRYRLLRLSRNFGHQIAVTAGLDHADGDAVVILDADLQDPPEVVLEMARRWREGYQIAYGLRTDRAEDSWFKRTSASGFYRVLNGLSSVDMPAQVGDFRLIDRVVVDAVKAMPEHNRYIRGMFSWLGFSQVAVPYERPARWAGSTSYSVKRMVGLANDGVIGFSKVPLRAVLGGGVVALGLGATGMVGGGVVALLTRRANSFVVPSLKVLTVGAQLAALGIVGEYVARIFDESLQRPLYVVRDTVDRTHTEQTYTGQTHTGQLSPDDGASDRNGRLHDLSDIRNRPRSLVRSAGEPLQRSGS